MFLTRNLDVQRNLASLICVYTVEVCEQEIPNTNEHYPDFEKVLLSCLQFHTGQIIEKDVLEIETIIQTLQRGRSPAGGYSLGGDPLRDSVLSTALLINDAKAILIFENNYFDYLQRVAYRVHPQFGTDPYEWWNEFLDFLAGYSHTKGKLKKYHGHSALRSWLRVVLWNFLQRRPLPGHTTEITDEVPMPNSHSEHSELNDSLTVFTKLVRESLSAVPERDRLLLSMIYIDGLLKKDIANVFQVHPGQIGRWEEAALQRLRTEIAERLEKFRDKNVHEEIMGGIVNNPKEFSEALTDALKQLQTASQTPNTTPEDHAERTSPE